MSLYNFYTDEEVKEAFGLIPTEFDVVAEITEGDNGYTRAVYAEKMGTDHWYFVDNGECSCDRDYVSIDDLLKVLKYELCGEYYYGSQRESK